LDTSNGSFALPPNRDTKIEDNSRIRYNFQIYKTEDYCRYDGHSHSDIGMQKYNIIAISNRVACHFCTKLDMPVVFYGMMTSFFAAANQMVMKISGSKRRSSLRR
jgi:hypothetical protein